MKASEETKQKAKAAGIKSWHVKSEEKLQTELEALETETVDVATELTETTVEKVKPVVETKSKEDELPDGVTPEEVWIRIRSMKEKSRYWKYRHLAKAPSNYRG